MSKENSKTKNVVKVVIILILVVILMLGIYFIRRVCIVNTILNNMAKNLEITNIQYSGKNLTNENLKSEATQYTKDEKVKITADSMDIYLNYDGKAYFVNEENKEYLQIVNETMDLPDKSLSKDVYKEASFMEKIKLAVNWKIENDEVNGEKCYHLIIDDNEYWVSKDKYFIIKQKDSAGNIEEYKNIKVDSVTDEMMKLPDFSNYSEIKTN